MILAVLALAVALVLLVAVVMYDRHLVKRIERLI